MIAGTILYDRKPAMGGTLFLRPGLILAQTEMDRALDIIDAYLQAADEQTAGELYIELVQ